MTVPIWLWLLVALLVFWCVGVYNRVMRLKARTVEVLGALERQTQAWVQLVLTGLPPTWSALHGLARELDGAGKNVLAQPLKLPAQTEFARCIDAIQHQWAATCAAPTDMAEIAFPAELLAPWDEAALKVQSARAALNQSVADYNQALQQFPASLVVGIMGFRAAFVV